MATWAERVMKLEDILARGVNSVDFGDGKGSVTYASLKDILTALAYAREQAAIEAGTVTVTARVVMPWISSGFHW